MASLTVEQYSRFRSRLQNAVLVDASLAVFVTAMLVAMVVMPGDETIPYHLMFLSLALVYGFRVWPMRPTLLVISAITAVTGLILYAHYLRGSIDSPELAEVPLMPMLLLAMVWHARRRADSQQEVERMADDRQRRLEREREFLRDTSHAIRTPVTIARGHVELIQANLTDPVSFEDSEVVLRQLDRMCALSTRMLALARLDSAHPMRLRPLEQTVFVNQMAANWMSSADRDWAITRADCGLVIADREWLELVIDALIENAVHFTGPGDRIELSCWQQAEMGKISVTDSGVGIEPDDLPHVFGRFWHRRPPDGVPGSGLGLSMALAAVQAMGGSLDVTSTIGTGSRFELSLPVVP
jgi:signal transduction histidine kinase